MRPRLAILFAMGLSGLACCATAQPPGSQPQAKDLTSQLSALDSADQGSPETLNGVYGGSKAFVLAFSQSLQHELGPKGIRIQAVLPGATATEFWDIAGLPVTNLPAAIVMSAADMVDAALAGLDQGEVVTIPSLPDQAEWDRFEAARRAMSTRLSSTAPASRYKVEQRQTAEA